MDKSKLQHNELLINTAAIAENYRIIQNFVGNKVKCAANIKCDAYGLGKMQAMRQLSFAGCNKFFVSSIEDAMEIRNISLTDEIYVLGGINKGEEDYFAQNNILPVLNTDEEFNLYDSYCKKKNRSFAAILNIDTGINIIGIPYAKVFKAEEKDYFKQKVKIAFVLSNFDSDNENIEYSNLQIQKLNDIKNKYNVSVSFAGSMGITLDEKYHFDIVRAGLLLFGFSVDSDMKLANVITLKSRIVQLRNTDESFEMRGAKKIATIPIGYSDGILTSLANKAAFDVAGYSAPIIGKITSDYTVLDVTNIPKDELYIGAEVEILGKNSSLQKTSIEANISFENIICSLSSRIERIYR